MQTEATSLVDFSEALEDVPDLGGEDLGQVDEVAAAVDEAVGRDQMQIVGRVA
jgi:hypothetical protein